MLVLHDARDAVSRHVGTPGEQFIRVRGDPPGLASDLLGGSPRRTLCCRAYCACWSLSTKEVGPLSRKRQTAALRPLPSPADSGILPSLWK
jgi:hypothetical protein